MKIKTKKNTKTYRAAEHRAALFNKKELLRLASFPELNPNPILEIDLKNKISYQNPAAKLLFPKIEKVGTNHEWFADWDLTLKTIKKNLKEINRDVKVNKNYYHQTINYLPDLKKIRIYGNDITERVEKEEKLKKLHRIVKAISDSNHATIYAKTIKECLDSTCKIIIKDCGYPLMWIGFAENDEKKSVRTVAYSGFSKEYIDSLDITWADTERGRGPTGTAIRTGKPAMCKNMLTDPKFEPWRQNAITHGYASSLVLPLKSGDDFAFGAITIYSKLPDGFSKEEVDLFSELANDLAYGIRVIRSRKKLQASENKFKAMFESSPVGMFLTDVKGTIIDCNNVALQMRGRKSKDEIIGKKYLDSIDGQYQTCARENWEKLLKTGSINNVELKTTEQNGQKIDLLCSAVLLTNIAQRAHTVLIMTEDITERKKSEEHLVASKKEWERTFDSMPDLVAVLDKNHRIIRMNKPMAERLGTVPEKCIGLNCYKCVHGLNGPPAFCPHVLTLQDGKEHSAEIFEQSLNGNFIITTTPLIDGDGKITGSVHVARDISDRVKNEEKIKEQALMLENANDAVIGYDTNHTITFWNKAAELIYGYTEKEAIGKVAFDLLKTTYTNLTRNELIDKLKKAGKAEVESIRYTKTGKKLYVESHSIAIRDKNQKATGFVSTHRDVTQREKADERLKAYAHNIKGEKVRSEALLSSIGHGVVAIDKDGKITFANKKFRYFLNKNHSKLIGKKVEDVLHLYNEKDHLLKVDERPLNAALTGKTVVSHKFYCIGRKREKIYLNLVATPVILHGKVLGAIGVYNDITKDREAERAKTEFVSLASHQLRTPITEISLSTEMLLSGMLGKVNKGSKKYLQNIYDGVKEITDLIDSLLNISRIQMGSFVVNPRPTDLTQFIDKITQGFSMQIKKKGIKLKKYYAKGLPKLKIDHQMMELIVENLFSNAVKYTEKGHVGIDVNKDSKNVIIKIYDTGCGIPTNQQHLIFSKLFRSDNTLKSKTKGSGLGLYIVKSIVKDVGGKISFESKENKGTTFFVTLPLSGMKRKTQQSLI